MSVESTKHESAMEARDHFFEKFEEATLTGSWMAVVWKIEGGQIRIGSCTKHNFPDDDFRKALGLLKKHSPLVELPDDPLPSVDDSPVIQFAPTGEQVEDQVEAIDKFAETPNKMDWDKSEPEVRERILDSLGVHVQEPLKPNPGETQS